MQKLHRDISFCLNHLYRLTDNVGILEHCVIATPDLKEGYCVDDNARALQVALRLKEEKLADVYLKFLVSAIGENGFKNDLTRDLVWQDEELGENFGRAMAGFADAGSLGLRNDQKLTGMFLFDQCVKHIDKVQSIRTKAWLIYDLLKRSQCEPKLESILQNFVTVRISQKKIKKTPVCDFKEVARGLANELVEIYRSNSNVSWKWFENIITYDIGRLPWALFWAFSILDEKKYLDVARESLDFLLDTTFNKKLGCFVFPGYRGWYKKTGEKNIWGQQPIEAGSMAEVCMKAFQVTKEKKYLNAAKNAYNWFYGKNVLKMDMIDNESGGVFDGLEEKGVNLNQGAESIISFFMAYLSVNSLDFADKI